MTVIFIVQTVLKKQFKSHKKVCKDKYFCGVVMSFEDNKILKLNQYWDSDKTPLIIYADLESLIKKSDWCRNNLDKLSTTKVGKNIHCGYLISTIWKFDGIENKYDVHIGEDCMKKFCESLREHPMKIINFEKRKIIPLTNEEYESYFNQRIHHICLSINTLMMKNIVKLNTIVMTHINTEVFYIIYAI